MGRFVALFGCGAQVMVALVLAAALVRGAVGMDAAAGGLQRPYWRLGSPWPRQAAEIEERLRERLGDWPGLDEATARERAAAMADAERAELHNVAERLLALAEATGEARYKALAAAVLDEALAPALEALGGDPAGAITLRGSADADNLRARDIAFPLAMRYAARGDAEDFVRVRAIMLGFARAFPEWPIWYRGEAHAQDDSAMHRRWDGPSLWASGGFAYHRELQRSAPLLRAFDLIHGDLDPQDRQRIEDGVFRYLKEFIDQYQVWFVNFLGHRMLGKAKFGLVLPEPEYIHEVLENYHRMAYLGFFPDGFYREVSISYHRMPAARMRGLARRLKGYSDPEGYQYPLGGFVANPADTREGEALDNRRTGPWPPGYRHAEIGRRIEGLDIDALYARHHKRWQRAINSLVLPNRERLAVNDDHAGMRAWGAWFEEFGLELVHTAPRLLGTSRFAMLGAGGEDNPMQLYTMFANTQNHEHGDALNIVWFAHGREAFSETDYLPSDPDIPRSEGRRWNSSTAGHNTVVVNETNQHGRFSGNQRNLTPDDAMFGKVNWNYRWRAMNHGNLLLFDPGWPEVQAMEAEAERAYSPHARLYRRTLAMADLGGGDGYLVDIFRVRGGHQHDYMLHGCLDQEYDFETGLVLQNPEDTIYEFINVLGRAEARPPFSFAFRYKDGLRTITRVLSPTVRDGAGVAGVEFNVGRAPAMRRRGNAFFVALRRAGGAELGEPGQDNAFVLVHEASGGGETKIRSAELLPIAETDDPEAVALRVNLDDGREDVFLSTMGDGKMRLADGTQFRGRLGFLRREGGRTVAARVFDGRSLAGPGGEALVGDLPETGGTVLATRRMDNGDAVEGVVVDGLPEGAGELVGRTLFVEMDHDRDFVWAYRITGVHEEADGTVIEVEHDPGFEIREGGELTKLVYNEGWGFRSPAYWRVGSVGHWEAE